MSTYGITVSVCCGALVWYLPLLYFLRCKSERGDIQKSFSLQLNTATNTTEPKGGNHYLKKSIYTSYDELPLLLSVKQLVDLMGVSDSTIYELIQEDDFPSLRIGKRIVVPKEELRKWISAHTKGAKE